MRTLRYKLVIAAGLLAVSWAQRPKLRVISPSQLSWEEWKTISQMPLHRVVPLPPSETGVLGSGISEIARTPQPCDTSLFLPNSMPPHLDADTLRPGLRAIQQNIPDPQAGDTVIARVASRLEDTLLPATGVCFKPYFDSLNARGSYGIAFNEIASRNRQVQGLNLYDGNALATRFEIPSNAQPFAIKGVGFHLYNNFGISPRDCDLSTTREGSAGFSNGNGVYEIFVQVRRPRYGQFNQPDTAYYDVNGDGVADTLSIPVSYTYPGGDVGDTLYEASAPASQVRVGWFAATYDQCWGGNPPADGWRSNMGIIYFPQAYQVTPGDTFYIVVASELYDPDIDGIQDSLHLRLGPNYPSGSPNVPVWVADSLRALAPKPEGSSMWNLLLRDPNTGQFVGELWNSVSWTSWGAGFERLRSYHFGIYPVITLDLNATSFKWGEQIFGSPYPNPVVDCIHIPLESPGSGMARFQLMTTDGRIVQRWSYPLQGGKEEVRLDLGQVPAGTYLLHTATPYGQVAYTIVVLR